MPYCKFCMSYKNMEINSKKKKPLGYVPKLLISLDEYIKWRREHPSVCSYCGITDVQIEQLGIRGDSGNIVKSINNDRIDSDGDYTLENIRLCCFICNRMKSNIFSISEFEPIGLVVGEILQQRLQDAPQN